MSAELVVGIILGITICLIVITTVSHFTIIDRKEYELFKKWREMR